MGQRRVDEKPDSSYQETSTITGLALWSVQQQKSGETWETSIFRCKGRWQERPVWPLRRLEVLHCQLNHETCISAKELKEKTWGNFKTSLVYTNQQILRDNRYSQYCAPWRKLILTTLQRKKRILFSKIYLAGEPEKWKKLLWSDKATFTVTGNRGGKVRLQVSWDPYHHKNTEGTMKDLDSIMVWRSF